MTTVQTSSSEQLCVVELLLWFSSSHCWQHSSIINPGVKNLKMTLVIMFCSWVESIKTMFLSSDWSPDIDEKSIHIPQLPVLLFNLTARYDRGGDSVVICGVMEENMRHQCWILRNGTSWWEMINDTDTSETATNNHEDTAPHNPCSHRAGAVTTLLGQTLYMFGGKRCVVKISKQI